MFSYVFADRSVTIPKRWVRFSVVSGDCGPGGWSASVDRGGCAAERGECLSRSAPTQLVVFSFCVDVEARDGRTAVDSKAETGEGHSEEGWERDNGVVDNASGNGR